MKESFEIFESEDSNIVLYLDIETDYLLKIGDEINLINNDAYMNGYNWSILFKFYLEKYNPDVLVDMLFDPEAGAFYASIPKSQINILKAETISNELQELINDRDKLLSFVEKYESIIEWD